MRQVPEQHATPLASWEAAALPATSIITSLFSASPSAYGRGAGGLPRHPTRSPLAGPFCC